MDCQGKPYLARHSANHLVCWCLHGQLSFPDLSVSHVLIPGGLLATCTQLPRHHLQHGIAILATAFTDLYTSMHNTSTHRHPDYGYIRENECRHHSPACQHCKYTMAFQYRCKHFQDPTQTPMKYALQTPLTPECITIAHSPASSPPPKLAAT